MSRRRVWLAAFASALAIALVTAASAAATSARPPHTIWLGSAAGPKQTVTDESFVKVEAESPPGSEVLNFAGHTSISGTYEIEPGKHVPESFTGSYSGAIHCTGAESFEADLEGTVGSFSGVKVHVVYTGSLHGTEGSGTYKSTSATTSEEGTWKASLYAVAESAGSRPGEVEMINPSDSTATNLSAESAAGALPAGFVAPVGSLSYEVTELQSTVFDVSFKLPAGSHPTGAYKLVGGEYLPYPQNKTKIEGEQITLELEDNGPFDEDNTVGTLRDPIVPVAAEVPEFGRCEKAPTAKVGKKTVSVGKYT
ncbi:MAG: choice-of-anchor U domain-containing protein, partial [Solirubrobacteraceae bacterium]